MIKRSTWKLSGSFLVTHIILAITFFAFLPAVLGLINLLSGNISSSTSTSNLQMQQQDGQLSPSQENATSNNGSAQGQNSAAQSAGTSAAEPERNTAAEFIAGILSAGLYLFVMGLGAQGAGFSDRDRVFYNGFAAGVIASIPAAILVVMLTVSKGDVSWIKVVHRIWMSPYIEIYSLYEKHYVALAYATLPLMPIVTGIAYIRGIRKKDQVIAKLKATAPDKKQ